MAGDNLSDRGDRAGDSKAGELTRVIDGASKSAIDEVLDVWGPPPTSKTLFEKASDFVSHLSMESLPALSTNLFKRVTGKTEGQEHSEKQIKETGEKPQDKPTKHIYQSVEIEALAKKGDPVAIDTVKMLDKVGDNKDWRTIIKEAYTNVVTQFKNFITGGDRQLQEVPQVISGSLDTINETRFQAKLQENLKSTSSSGGISPNELIAEAKFTYNPDDQGYGSDSLPAITSDSSEQLEGHITKVGHIENNPIGWLKAAQRISQLPFDKQLQVIGAGLCAGKSEYNHQIRERSIGAVIGPVQGIGEIATNLGKVADFSAYLLLNDHERASQMGAEFGEALGTSIVGGVRLFEGAHHYLNDVGKAGYEGDYTKVFRDIDNLGKHLDKAWSELPPREQSRIISKLGTELAGDGLIGLGAAKAAGKLPGQFTKILDTISNDAQKLHRAGKDITEKSVRAIKEAVDDLLQPEFITPDGQKIKLGRLDKPRADKPETTMLMSKADDVGSGKPENLGPRKGREIQPVDEKEIVNPIDRIAPAEQKVAQLMALSEQNKPLVGKFLKAIDTKFGTKSEISVKTPQDILDKAKRPSIKEAKEWFDVEHVRDSLRFKTPVENLEALPKIVKHLLDGGFEVVKLDLDKLIKPKGRGWRMAAIDLKAPNGQILEYQLLPTEMNAAGKIEHQMYKQWRSKDVSKLSPGELNQKREVDAAAADLYTNAWDSYLKRNGQTQENIMEIIRQTYLVLE